MGKFMDLTGQRFGKLTVIERASNGRCSQTRWLCRCDCGQECIVNAQNLRSGKTKSCGCITPVKYPIKDLTGLRFGQLTVLGKAESKDRLSYWHCQCDCGETKDVAGKYLKNGSTKTCGGPKHIRYQNLTGKRFGDLTVIEHSQASPFC